MGSNARLLYDEIVKHDDPGAFLKAMVEPPGRMETEWLEFKGCLRVDEPEKFLRQDQIKQFWSEACSGFAKMGGGVLIWGIDARKNEHGIDCAQKLALYPNPRQLRSRLIELEPDAADPAVSGIVTEAFDCPGEEGGFVVSLIPESPDLPHAARLVKNCPYFFRSGDSFRVASQSLLRRLFYPHLFTRLRMNFLLEFKATGFYNARERDAEIAFQVQIENVGARTLKDILARFDVNVYPPIIHEMFSSRHEGNIDQDDQFKRLSSPILHPGQVLRLMEWKHAVRLIVENGKGTIMCEVVDYMPGYSTSVHKGLSRGLGGDFWIYSTDAVPHKVRFWIPQDDIWAGIQKAYDLRNVAGSSKEGVQEEYSFVGKDLGLLDV